MRSHLRPVYLGDAQLIRSRDGNGNTCVICDDRNSLTCPSCLTNQQCQFVYPTNCSVCPYATCVDKEVTSSSPPASSGPDEAPPKAGLGAGPLAGGVIGGVAVIGIITYLVWRNCIKARRGTAAVESWVVEEQPQSQSPPPEKVTVEHRSIRGPSSVRTRHSIASTVLTRASNIIQIAYIPGVTNRARPSSPGALVPPVPPIPVRTSPSSPSSPSSRSSRAASSFVPEDNKRFFVPGDLRDSTYSSFSGYTDQTDFRKSCYTNRSSVASTIYTKNAVVISAGQTGMRAKPAVVSVKHSGTSSTGSRSPPPVPSVDFEKFGAGVPRPPSPANSMFSVGSTFLNSASAASPARAMLVRVGSKPPTGGSMSPVSRDSRAATLIEDSPDLGPFADPPETPPPKPATSLSAVIEEATRRASARTSKAIPLPPATARGKSPFGDEHATRS